MSDPEIRETTVAPASNCSAIRIQISDAPLTAENASIVLDLHVRLPAYEAPLLSQVQRQAVRAAMDILSALNQKLIEEIQRDKHHELEPKIAPRYTQKR